MWQLDKWKQVVLELAERLIESTKSKKNHGYSSIVIISYIFHKSFTNSEIIGWNRALINNNNNNIRLLLVCD